MKNSVLITIFTWLLAAMLCVVVVGLLSTLGGNSGFIIPFLSDITDTSHKVFWQIRLPRNTAAFLAGAGLSISGAVFQALFRNSLATPYTLGVASGAAFGAALYIQTGLMSFAFFGMGIRAAAIAGALVSMILVYGIARRKQTLEPAKMLLAGVAVSFTFSGLMLFVHYLSDFAGSFRIVRWMMGSLDVVGFDPVIELAVVLAICTGVMLFHARALDLFCVGETQAMSRGLNVTRVRVVLFAVTSILVGQIVSITGPVGFVGMMVPHVCRRIISPKHRILLPSSFLAGGVFLSLADTFARTVIAPSEIPVGVITSLVGGPFFLALLIKNDRWEM